MLEKFRQFVVQHKSLHKTRTPSLNFPRYQKLGAHDLNSMYVRRSCGGRKAYFPLGSKNEKIFRIDICP